MRLSLYDHPDGVETAAGNRVVYDLERNEAHFGAARVQGHALRWELEEEGGGAAFSAEVAPSSGWLMRCDRVDFPPGGVAYRHVHPGPGIRRLLHGELTVNGRTLTPGQAWFEDADDPVVATASADEETAFVRVMLLPREWARKRTIRYVDPADEDKPKTQRATVFLDEPIEL